MSGEKTSFESLAEPQTALGLHYPVTPSPPVRESPVVVVEHYVNTPPALNLNLHAHIHIKESVVQEIALHGHLPRSLLRATHDSGQH